MECTVLTLSRSGGIGNGLTYEAPEGAVSPGVPVQVPLRNKITEGIVLDVRAHRDGQEFDVKSITRALSERPLLHRYQLETLTWMAKEYCCTLRQAVGAFLPGQSWRDLLPMQQTWYTMGKEAAVRGIKQRAVLEALAERRELPEEALMEASGCSRATLKTLLVRGCLVREERAEAFSPPEQASPPVRPALTPLQRAAASQIAADARPSLLFGVTGSGKTEIYAELIANAVAEGKSAILLVPEILLTEHCIHRFHALLDPERIAVVHSRLTPGNRRAMWRKIREGGVDLVIGSRSALFSPLERLGVVILDEEHEWTYKNEQTPRYHARETAEALCKFAGAKLLLGSATPSLESWARAKEGRYHLARLPDRFASHALPEVRIVDLASVSFGSLYPFSPPLLEAIEVRLRRGEQSILFLNRRGMASALLCLDCRRRITSPDSQLPFTVHRGPGGKSRLVDHTTNLTVDLPGACPHCGSSRLHEIGAGTERVEDILAHRFPQARLLRADRDTLAHPEHMRLLLKKMREGQADILLGTQSVVKGLDLPGVTLAAVLLADIGLSLPHFRAGERIFQLLTQLTGRSGRAKPGEVIIQTFRPDAPEVRLSALHKTEEYLENELKLRTHAGYPPASRMVRLLLSGPSAGPRAGQLAAVVREVAELHKLPLAVSVAPTLFGGGKTWHVLLRGADPASLLPQMDLADATVDIDPVECI